MELALLLAIGLLAGWAAGKLTHVPQGERRGLVVGLVGSVIGGFLARRAGVAVVPTFWGELLTATGGAAVLLALWQAVRPD